MKKKILVVDDEPTTVEQVKEALEVHQYKVITALDGRRGLQSSLLDRPDLILLDVLMPMMDGFELLSHLKSNERTKHIPVVMLTAKGESSSILRSKELQATDYLIKPFALDDLLKAIQRSLL